MNNFYYCYSPQQYSFLKQSGIKYITKGRNTNSNSYFWLYSQNNELSNALIKYKEKKGIFLG